MRNRTLISRVRKLEQREELLMDRTDNPILPVWRISALRKRVWDYFLIIWDWTLVRTQILQGRVWRVDLTWSGGSVYNLNPREYIGLNCYKHLGTDWRFCWSIIINFHCRSHRSKPWCHMSRQKKLWRWYRNHWNQWFQVSIPRREGVCWWSTWLWGGRGSRGVLERIHG